jgi:hypothetical protein
LDEGVAELMPDLRRRAAPIEQLGLDELVKASHQFGVTLQAHHSKHLEGKLPAENGGLLRHPLPSLEASSSRPCCGRSRKCYRWPNCGDVRRGAERWVS